MKQFESSDIIKELVNFVLPELTPYELSFYLFLLGKSYFKNGKPELRIGKRTIAYNCGKGTRSDKANFQHVTKILKSLEEKGCIKIGDTNREGTLYHVNLSKDIPFVAEKIASFLPKDAEEDYFNIAQKRQEIFERDKWICQYCGEKITPESATLDHFIPQSKGGKNSKENLRTSCFICNGVKSGKTYEEAAPFLLKSIQERKERSHK
jgi:5-methylcytosine-specific restriction endonuclease McrA